MLMRWNCFKICLKFTTRIAHSIMNNFSPLRVFHFPSFLKFCCFSLNSNWLNAKIAMILILWGILKKLRGKFRYFFVILKLWQAKKATLNNVHVNNDISFPQFLSSLSIVIEISFCYHCPSKIFIFIQHTIIVNMLCVNAEVEINIIKVTYMSEILIFFCVSLVWRAHESHNNKVMPTEIWYSQQQTVIFQVFKFTLSTGLWYMCIKYLHHATRVSLMILVMNHGTIKILFL